MTPIRLFALTLVVTLAACHTKPGDEAVSPAATGTPPVADAHPPPDGDTVPAATEPLVSHWQCGEMRISTHFDNVADQATLSVAGRQVTLRHAMSGSGARYADDQGNEFWSKGDSAQLTLAGEERRDCSLADEPSPWDAAKARNVGFRAVGNEPGWLVEVTQGEAPTLHAELDYGARKIDVAHAQPLADSGFQGKTAKGLPVTLRIERTGCVDDMSGTKYEASAVLSVGGKDYKGCGAYLFD